MPLVPSFPSNITRDDPPSLLILQGMTLLPFECRSRCGDYAHMDEEDTIREPWTGFEFTQPWCTCEVVDKAVEEVCLCGHGIDERLRRKEKRERDYELYLLFEEDVNERFAVTIRFSGSQGAQDWAKTVNRDLTLAQYDEFMDINQIFEPACTYISNTTLHAIFQRVLGCLTWPTGELKIEDKDVRETIGDEGWIFVKVRLLRLPPRSIFANHITNHEQVRVPPIRVHKRLRGSPTPSKNL
jgi:hypothetical protein